MKTVAIVLLLLLAGFPPQGQNEPIARGYFQKLYAVGGLDRLADLYVCYLDTSKDDTFLIFAEAGELRKHLKKVGRFNGLPKEEQDLLNRNILIARFYVNGNSQSGRVLMTREGNRWVGDWNKAHTRRTTLGIDQKTLNVGWFDEVAVDDPASDGKPHDGLTTIPVAHEHMGNFGHCENIPFGVEQHGSGN